jgi:hypothetical protein
MRVFEHFVIKMFQRSNTQRVETTGKQWTKLQTRHNNEPACRKGEPLECKQPKKSIALRQVDDAPYEVEWELYIIKNV